MRDLHAATARHLDIRVTLIALAAGTIVSLSCSHIPEEGAADAGAGVIPPVVAPEPAGATRTPGPADPPAEEICDAVDNDLDGRVDEVGCACTGETACFAGPPQARGVGECRDGVRGCVQNEFFGACEGSVGPSIDACGDGLDSDCDGQVDECCDGGCDGGAGDGGPMGDGDSGGDPGPGGDRDGGRESFIVGASEAARPTDFVMVIDNSGSMKDTVARVEANLGAFASRLAGAGIDYRFALISERGTNPRKPDVCVTPPMAGPACGDTDRFVHRDQKIGSENGFERLLECWHACDDGAPGIRDFLRENALLQIIMVTDDESDLDWADFHGEVAALGYPDFVLHGVVGLEDDGCVADRGDQYIHGAEETGGELLDICGHDWGDVLDVLLDATVNRLERTFALAGAPDPATLRVFVVDVGGGEREQIGNWRYDPATNSVTFDDAAPLSVGARVVVSYRPL